ncbi:hypothetical protein M899_1310 [Bacteriovorax sp. BSW11_IV]|uniref:hypothetical protein n=1 Tax=Bacteriovorax sp. BSW11_IV TaxID=1353529 RepID=UPI000389E852|nr:hypothetical protein [Bacteriovorax sp. BSW11_IV]EQC45876.1 hypothetical protein M899_1310 [Bacteriovorax sp. BSW11_IV]
MDVALREHLEKALTKYTSEEYFKDLVSAKDEYFAMAGKVLEEDDDFENRMSSFNLWYLMQRRANEKSSTYIETYVKENELEEDVGNALVGANHSLFEYSGTNFRKKHVIKDILHDRKIYLEKDYIMPSIVKDDIFIGRTLDFKEKSFLLDGITVVPGDVRSVLVKESKKVRKLQDLKRDFQFLMQIEAFKTKWRRYGHIDAKKIFQFRI